MAGFELEKYSVSMKFANGETASGGVKTMSVSIGALNQNAYDQSKAFTLASALSRAYTQMLMQIEETRRGSLVYSE